MASKRALKKRVHHVCESLVFESAILLSESAPEKIYPCVLDIARLENETIRRIGSIEKLGAKSHYTKLKEEFAAEVDKLVATYFPA
ncbi:MAG: hypothetical protein Q4A44_04800 [Bacteroidales bacterium]|nr:hypothetical protein [Bacteroidales bacterium]